MSESKKKSLDLIIKTTGRGSVSNNSGRFNQSQKVYDITDADYYLDEDDIPNLKTEFFVDNTKTILNRYDSPDMGSGVNLNPYRGCEHGCIYCYARPTHEYFNLSAGLDFESKIFYKEKAPELLQTELRKKSWEPQIIMMSGITDCYQPIERKMQITRRCLEVLAEFKNPTVIITKNFLVTRDIDILAAMAKERLVSVCISITSLDDKLARTMEPRTSSPQRRLEAVRLLTAAGVPVSVNIAPIVPGLTDHEFPKIMAAAAEAGARSANYVIARLPHSVKDLFVEWLDQNYPDKKDKVVGAIRDVRNGKLYDASFSTRMVGTGARAEHISEMFGLFHRRHFGKYKSQGLRTDLFKCPPQAGDQLKFDV